MTDEPSAREIAKQIVREYQPYAYPSWADSLTARIESAILSHGRRERARGMRETDELTVKNARIMSYAGILLNDAEWQCVLMAMDRLAYPSDHYRSAWTKVSNIAAQHRARETERTEQENKKPP
jgi:hypothetical protein